MTQRAGRELTLYVLFIVKNLTNHLNICTTAFPTPITNKLFVNIAILTGVLVKIDANFPDEVAPIFSKMCNMKYLHDILAYAKNFDPQSLCSPKKWPFFTLTCHFHMEI